MLGKALVCCVVLYKLVHVRQQLLFAYSDTSIPFSDAMVAIPGVDRCGFVVPAVGALLAPRRLAVLLEHLRSNKVTSDRGSAVEILHEMLCES